MREPELFQLPCSKLVLRTLLASDAASLIAYRSLPAVARFQSWATFDHRDAHALISQHQDLTINTPGTWYQLGLVETSSKKLIGDCGLHFLAEDPAQVEIGITVSPDYQNAGFASEAVECLLAYLFTNLEKHRVIALTDVHNAAAARLFLRAGFRQEARFEKNRWFKGDYCSEFLFALLSSEWSPHRHNRPSASL